LWPTSRVGWFTGRLAHNGSIPPAAERGSSLGASDRRGGVPELTDLAQYRSVFRIGRAAGARSESSWRAAPKWLWGLVSGVYFGVGLLVSEFWFGWATEEDLQPNIDGLSRDEVLLIGLVPVAVAVIVTRWMARRHARQAADEHEESSARNRG
jgi:hypothetical protein